MQTDKNIIPIFPLSLVVFPGEYLNLHIFEKRYKALVNNCLSKGEEFGIPVFIEGTIGQFGTSVQIDKIDRVYSGGEMDIKTIGTKSFKIKRLINDKNQDSYMKAEVNWIEHISNGSDVLKNKIFELSKTLHKFLRIDSKKIESFEAFELHKVIHILGLKLSQEYRFLQLNQEIQRQEFLLQHLKSILPIVEETEQIKRKIESNGHFKNIIPPKI